MSVTISGSGQIVKQLIQATYSGAQVNTTSTTYVATGLTATITPTNSANKILVIATGSFANGGSGNACFITIGRNGATVGDINAIYAGSTQVWSPSTINYLDSPATTSATTYAMYFKSSSGNSSFNWTTGFIANITLMEIAYA